MNPDFHLLLTAGLFAALTFTGSLPAAHFDTPPAALVVLNRAGGTSDEFSSVVEITKIEFQSPVALKVLLPNGQPLTIPKNEVVRIFWYPDPMAVLADAADASTLSAMRAEATALAARFPKAKAICERVIAGIDADLQKLAAGQARYRGVWQSPASPGTSPAASSKADFASLDINGTTYTNVVISRLVNGSVLLQHEGGVVRIPLTEASPELLRALRSKLNLFRNAAPVPELVLENAKLTGVRVAAEQGDNVILLHDSGLSTIPKNSLSAIQQRALFIEPEEPKSAASSSQSKRAKPGANEEKRNPGVIEPEDASAPDIPGIDREAAVLGMSLDQYEHIRKVAVILGADYLVREKATALAQANSACAMLITHAMRIGHAAVTANIRMRRHDASIPSVTLQESVNDALKDMLAAVEHHPMPVAATFALRERGMITAQEAEYRMADLMAAMSLRFERRDRLLARAEASGFCRTLEENGETVAAKLQMFFGTIDADVQQTIISALMSGDKNAADTISALLKAVLNGKEDLALTRNELDMTPEEYAAQLMADNQRVIQKTNGQRTLGHELFQFRRDQLKGAGAASFSNTSEIDRINHRAHGFSKDTNHAK